MPEAHVAQRYATGIFSLPCSAMVPQLSAARHVYSECSPTIKTPGFCEYRPSVTTDRMMLSK